MQRFSTILSTALVILLLNSCVERIEFTRIADSLIIIEGMISDDPGPYTIKVSKGKNLDLNNEAAEPITELSIELTDDLGNSEFFAEVTPGVYQTEGVIQGRIGGTYQVRIESPTGEVYESIPEVLMPAGEVEEIRYVYEARTSFNHEFLEETRADVFNIYFDARSLEGQETSYSRWKYTGMYKVEANPERHFYWIQGGGIPKIRWPDPWPCSGYIFAWDYDRNRATIEQVGECDCCTCWITDFERVPLLADGQLVVNGEFNNVKVAEIPINPATFYDKFRVEVEQMSLSKNAFDFFNLIREQKIGTDDLFQPIPAELYGNIAGVNNDDLVVGLFWATSINSKVIYIEREDVPYPLTPIEIVINPCQEFYNNSTNIQPDIWDE